MVNFDASAVLTHTGTPLHRPISDGIRAKDKVRVMVRERDVTVDGGIG